MAADAAWASGLAHLSSVPSLSWAGGGWTVQALSARLCAGGFSWDGRLEFGWEGEARWFSRTLGGSSRTGFHQVTLTLDAGSLITSSSPFVFQLRHGSSFVLHLLIFGIPHYSFLASWLLQPLACKNWKWFLFFSTDTAGFQMMMYHFTINKINENLEN